MKHLLCAAILAVLAGCAGLSINADFWASYRSDVPVGTRTAGSEKK